MTDARLLIPLAELPGLDPVGLVVHSRSYGELMCLGWCYDAPDRNIRVVRNAGPWPRGWGLVSAWHGEYALDLSDAATRDRCLRWLAGRVELPKGCGAPTWKWHSALRCWLLSDGDGHCHTFARDWLYVEHHVPTLADLDPTDDTRLSDGSRLVDALALAAVLRHVGGAE